MSCDYFRGKKLRRRNEFPEDDSYAKHLFRNFLHIQIVTQGLSARSWKKLLKEPEEKNGHLRGLVSKGSGLAIDKAKSHCVLTALN